MNKKIIVSAATLAVIASMAGGSAVFAAQTPATSNAATTGAVRAAIVKKEVTRKPMVKKVAPAKKPKPVVHKAKSVVPPATPKAVNTVPTTNGTGR